MKKTFLYLFLILPVASFSQCPKWIGGSVDSILILEKVAEKYLQVSLTELNDKKDKPNIDFVNKTCLCEFLYSVSKQRMKGKKGNKKYPAVNKILIVGPEDRVSKMYTEYFYPLIKPCASSIQAASMSYNESSIGYYLLSMHGQKLAEIILHK